MDKFHPREQHNRPAPSAAQGTPDITTDNTADNEDSQLPPTPAATNQVDRKRHACPHCSASFGLVGNLDLHVKIAHANNN